MCLLYSFYGPANEKTRRWSGDLLQVVDSEATVDDDEDEDEDMPDAEDASPGVHRTVSLTCTARLPPGESDAVSLAHHQAQCHAAAAAYDGLTQFCGLWKCLINLPEVRLGC